MVHCAMYPCVDRLLVHIAVVVNCPGANPASHLDPSVHSHSQSRASVLPASRGRTDRRCLAEQGQLFEGAFGLVVQIYPPSPFRRGMSSDLVGFVGCHKTLMKIWDTFLPLGGHVSMFLGFSPSFFFACRGLCGSKGPRQRP